MSGLARRLRPMQTWLVAIVGGAIGSIVTAVLTVGARLLRARGEVTAHDRFVASRDEDLSSWVSDRSLALRRELKAKTEELNRRNLFHSSAHGTAIAVLKEKALHEYRDQERQTRRDVAIVAQAENWMHRLWRRGGELAQLEAPSRAEPVLEIWRSSVTRHGSPSIEVVDPTRRTLEETVRELGASASKDFM
jgi:hypothetical protein